MLTELEPIVLHALRILQNYSFSVFRQNGTEKISHE